MITLKWREVYLHRVAIKSSIDGVKFTNTIQLSPN